MTRRRPIAAGFFVLCLTVALLSALPAQAEVLPSGFRDEVVVGGLEEPMAFDFAADGRVFVAEKAGKVLVYDDLEDETPELFADIRTDVYDTGDRGIMSMELDPEFPTRPYVYVLYTYDHLLGDPNPAPKWGQPNDTGDDCPKPAGETQVDACPVSGRLVRLEAGGPGGNQMVDQLPLVEGWCQQYSSHSVGDIQFDSVGNLYASGGEGGNALTTDYGQFGWPQKNQCGDPPAGIGGTQTVPTGEGGALRAQDVRTPNPLGGTADPTGLSGTLIRIDRDTGEGVPGNPMFDSLDPNERRIVANGFRNPFRFELDTEEDDLYIANVGWVDFEEIDHMAVDSENPFNSGWPCYEGSEHQESYDGLDLNLCEALYADEGEPDEASSPFFSYGYDAPVFPDDPCPHDGGAAISGTTVYRDDVYPAAYDGALFFADSVRSCIYAMMPDEHKKPDPSRVKVFMSNGGVYPGIDLEVGPDGNLYYARIFGGEDGKGALHRVAYDPGAPDAQLTASETFGAADPLVTDLDASGSTDPQDEDLSFDWDLDGDGDFDDVVDGPAKLDDQPIAGPAPKPVRVRVSDEGGSSSVAQVVLHPGNTPPIPEIEEPLEDLEWGVGETISFEGSAEDPQEGPLEDSALHWSARLLHCPSVCHEHPLQVFPAVEHGSFVAPDHDYPAKLRLVLTVTDSEGLTATKTVTIEPRAVDLEIASDPAGLTLGAGFKNEPAPFTLTAIEGGTVELSAPETQELGGDTYAWQGWSDGGARVHSVVADEAKTYTALYALDQDLEFLLTLKKDGPGTGTVTSAPAGINCGTACDEEATLFPEDTVVTLSQTPAAGSDFAGWSGCEQEVAGTCKVTMDEAEEVQATFTEESDPEFLLTLKKAGSGEGTVTSAPAGVNCGPACDEDTALYPEDTVVTLTQTAATGSDFVSWSGCEEETAGTCKVTMDEAEEVQATFAAEPRPDFLLTAKKAGTGTGTVTSAPAGIDCGTACDEDTALFVNGTVVTLSQAAAAGSQFVKWAGCEQEVAGTCKVTMDKAETVVATFDEKPADKPEDPKKPDDPGKPADPSPPVLGPPAPPQTRLLGHPKKKTTKSTARFRFDSNIAAVRFACILDRRDYVPCRSPKAYKNLRPGQHVFTVVAVSADELADPTPVKFRWRVLEKKTR